MTEELESSGRGDSVKMCLVRLLNGFPKVEESIERMTAKKVRKVESSWICCHTVCRSQYYFKLKFKSGVI